MCKPQVCPPDERGMQTEGLYNLRLAQALSEKKEEPDSILPTLGGQAALNIAMELDESGFLRENHVQMIGTSSETIKKAEDRLEFK